MGSFICFVIGAIDSFPKSYSMLYLTFANGLARSCNKFNWTLSWRAYNGETVTVFFCIFLFPALLLLLFPLSLSMKCLWRFFFSLVVTWIYLYQPNFFSIFFFVTWSTILTLFFKGGLNTEIKTQINEIRTLLAYIVATCFTQN